MILLSMRPKTITIIGVPGSGKTSLAKYLGRKLRWPVIVESIRNNPYFKQYAEGNKKAAFKMQLSFLRNHFTRYASVVTKLNSTKGIVIDGGIPMQTAYIRQLVHTGYISRTEQQQWKRELRKMTLENNYPDPTLVINSTAPLEVCQRRLARRGSTLHNDAELLSSFQKHLQKVVGTTARQNTRILQVPNDEKERTSARFDIKELGKILKKFSR